MRTPSGGLHAYFAGSDQRNGHLPGCYLDFRSAGGYVLAPPSQVGGQPYQLLREPGGRGGLDWDAVTQLVQPQPQHHRRSRRSAPAITSTTWPAGSPPSPKATATPACSGPPTAPWKPTRPPT